MNRRLINWIGLTGIAAFLSYMMAMILSPIYFPGYDWMKQAVSDLSAYSAPSKQMWDRFSAIYDAGSVVCITCVCIYISERKEFSKLFRVGIYLFTIMNWISKVGYGMFALNDAGSDISGFGEAMHMAVTACVVLLSIISLVIIIIAGHKDKRVRGEGIWAFVCLVLMFLGPIGLAAFPPELFGIFERFSTCSAVGYNAILGIYLFNSFK